MGCGHVHPCCRLRLCKQSTATLGVRISGVASQHQNLWESHDMQMTAPTHHQKIPTHHSRPAASQPCIDPPSVSEGSHQAEPLCSDQRKDSCSRKLVNTNAAHFGTSATQQLRGENLLHRDIYRMFTHCQPTLIQEMFLTIFTFVLQASKRTIR